LQVFARIARVLPGIAAVVATMAAASSAEPSGSVWKVWVYPAILLALLVASLVALRHMARRQPPAH
jgi:hypothetical protein